jgi:hypothetical protein
MISRRKSVKSRSFKLSNVLFDGSTARTEVIDISDNDIRIIAMP